MQNGREIDLSLANIVINEQHGTTDIELADYQYLVNKKFEELVRDRLEQFKRVTQKNPNFYSLETYLKEYENQSGNKLSKSQIAGIRNFDRKMQDGLITGKYNLEDYNTFLESIPDLLSGKKALAIGSFDSDGRFWIQDEIYEKTSGVIPRDVNRYTTYTLHPLTRRGEHKFARENFEVIPSPNIRKRMKSGFIYKLRALNLNDTAIGTHYSKLEEPRPVKLHGKGEPLDIKLVGERSSL